MPLAANNDLRVGAHDFNSARALLATLLAAGSHASAADFRAYQGQLSTHFTADFLVSLEVQACLRDGDIAGARTAFASLGKGPENERMRHHLEIMLSKHGSEDTLTRLREEFLRTDHIFDLEQLIQALREFQQWQELAQYTREMFNRSKNIESAELHIDALRRSNQWKALVNFFAEYPEFAEKRGMLAGQYAQACLFLAKWDDVQDAIRSGRLSESLARKLELQVPLLSLQWQNFNAQIDQALADPSSYTAESLLQLATVAATLGRAADSRQLTARAAAAAPDDPRILMSSFYRASKGAWDDEHSAGEWLQSAIKYAGDDGVVQRKSLAELAELAPRWRERSEKAWASLQSGQIWLDAYAKWLNQQLSQITVGAAIANCVQPDVRVRSIIPAFSGARQPSPLASGKTVALDVTALMNLAYLDLLDELLDIYSNVVVPHDTGVWLFEEFQHAEFHQPRLIEEASRLLSQVAQDKIQICPKVIIEDSELASRVGLELADLLHRAKEVQVAGDAAFVIRTSPVHLADSLLQKEAELSAYGGVLRSLICVIESLDRQGALTVSEKENALAYLRQVDRGWEGDVELSPGAVLLLDDLAVSYLQHLGLLAKLTASNFKLVIHRQLRNQAKSYDALRESGQRMHDVLTKVRDFLAEGVRSGKISVLPAPMENWGKASELPSPTTDLFAIEGKYDSILIDDRFFNRYPAFDQKNATSIPIHCTLDVIDHLRDSGKISDREWLSYRTNLRRSGYALIPVTESELAQAAASTQVLPNTLRESLDLRSIREAVALTQTRGILQLPLETAWLESLTAGCNGLLGTLVRSPADNRQAGLLAWLLALVAFRDFGEVFPGEVIPERLRYLSLAMHVRLITASMFEEGGTIPSSVVDDIFDSLLWQAPLAHRWLAEQSKRMLFDLKGRLDQTVQSSREKRHIPMLLWRGINALPAPLRSDLIDDEIFLAKLDIPIVPELRLNTPGNPMFNRDRIWKVVSKVLHDGVPTEVEDRSGKQWCISRDAEGRAVLDIQGVPRPLAFPDIEYMSVDTEVRAAHLSDRCAAMGVDQDQLSGSVLADLRNGPLTAFDVEQAQLLFARFPLPLHERLIGEMQDGETTLSSLFPSDFSYYEHLIGAWRGERDILAFASNMLPMAQEASFDVRLLVRLLSSGHSATSPRNTITHADAAEIKEFFANHVSHLDIWSLTAFLEGMLARERVIEEFGDELLQLLEAFDKIVNKDEQRRQLAAMLVKAAEIRIRSLSPNPSLPPYWRRLAAIAHGAVAERALMSARVNLDPFLERLEPLVVPYNPAGIVDMQREPTWAPFLMNGQQLQQEVLRRVLVAWDEHVESSSSLEPHREKFTPILRELLSRQDFASRCVRGPADGSVRLYELSADQCREMEQLLDDHGTTRPLDVWFAFATAGTAALLPLGVRDRLVASIEQAGTAAFAGCDENQSGHVLAWLGFLAASSRDTNLAKAIIKLARAVAASAEADIPATLCLYVTAIAAAAFSDRSEWQKLLINCAEHAAYTCTTKKDAINSLAAIEGFATADWRLQLPLARARAALKGLIHKA